MIHKVEFFKNKRRNAVKETKEICLSTTMHYLSKFVRDKNRKVKLFNMNG